MQDMYLKDGRNFLYVGDVGRKLVINIPNLEITRVCYETKEGFTKDVKVETSGEIICADIPDLFLGGAYSALTCYAIACDGDYEYTASEAHFEIKERQKSEGYSPTEQQLITWDYIERKALEYMKQTELYMGQAGDSADNASDSADNASDSADLAMKYAENNEDVAVESGKYSAKHWAIKSDKKYQEIKDYLGSASDPTSVLGYIESAKVSVGTMKNDVSTMKTSVEGSEENVSQMKAEAEQILKETQQTVAGKADKSELAVERARIDNLSKLAEGSTTGDAELMDIRIGADGVTYGNAGTAVRTQISNLKGDLTDVQSVLFNEQINYLDINSSSLYINKRLINNVLYDKVGFFTTDYIQVSENDVINITFKDGAKRSNKLSATYLNRYTEDKTFISCDQSVKLPYMPDSQTKYIRISIPESRLVDDSTISELKAFEYMVEKKSETSNEFYDFGLVPKNIVEKEYVDNKFENLRITKEQTDFVTDTVLEGNAIEIQHSSFVSGIVVTSNGETQNSTDYATTDYIDVSNFIKIFRYINSGTNNTSAFYDFPYAFYDKDKKLLSFHAIETHANTDVMDEKYGTYYIIPYNATYLRVSCSVNVLDGGSSGNRYHYVYVEKQHRYTVPSIDLTEEQKKSVYGLGLVGKTIVNFGDSIFGKHQDGDNSVSDYIRGKTGATVYNLGFGGCQMANHSLVSFQPYSMCNIADAIVSKDFSNMDAHKADSGVPSYFTNTIAVIKTIDFNDVDICTIGYGTNDFTDDNALDNADNLYDTETVIGALRYSVKKLLEEYPHLKFVIITPTYRVFLDKEGQPDSDVFERSQGKLTDYVEAEINASKELHLQFIDNYNCGINKYNRNYYLPIVEENDGTHHNENGRKLLGERIAVQLMSMF